MRAITATALVLPLTLIGQSANTVVGVDLDTTVIRIGEQVHMKMHVSYSPNSVKSIVWPTIADTLERHVEVVHDSGVDTVAGDGALARQVRTLTLTSFDTGFWAVPPFRFVVDGTTLESTAQLIEVRTTELDSSLALRDIKDIVVLPFSAGYWLREHWVWFAIGAASLAILATVLYLVLRKRGPSTPSPTPTVVIALHERILRALEVLDKERVWQQGDHKGYHSRITDLLRGYIEERYRLPALESTTDELVKELRVSPLSPDQRGQLENVLRLADMVKFAKALPSPQENEQMMAFSQRFVRETAAVQEPVDHG
ncbi:MAG TPA: hypothetical protein PLB89_05460 [Flavobacteriales bacterium]|nr:hypothetical protein [Flavobacteriales bacterium]